MPGTQKLTLVWSPAARRDLIRLREFIEPNNPHAARRSSEKIRKAANLISDNPAIGTRIEGRDDYELFTPFGRYGYIRAIEATYMKSYANAELQIIGNAGHYPMDETPVQLATVVERFLAG